MTSSALLALSLTVAFSDPLQLEAPLPGRPSSQVIVQSEADAQEAKEADQDRIEAETADRDPRRPSRTRSPGDQAQRDIDAADDLAAAMDLMEAVRETERENAATIAEWERVEANRIASCRIVNEEAKAAEIAKIRTQYGAMIENLRQVGGPAMAQTIEGLERSRDVGIDGVVNSDCKSPVEEGFDREREEQIRRMREQVVMPPFVRRPDGSIGPATTN